MAQYVSIYIHATSIHDDLAGCISFQVAENNLLKGGVNQYKHHEILFYFNTM